MNLRSKVRPPLPDSVKGRNLPDHPCWEDYRSLLMRLDDGGFPDAAALNGLLPAGLENQDGKPGDQQQHFPVLADENIIHYRLDQQCHGTVAGRHNNHAYGCQQESLPVVRNQPINFLSPLPGQCRILLCHKLLF